MRRSASKLRAIQLLLIFTGALFAQTAFAEPLNIGINPARFEFSASRGEVPRASLEFSNNTGEPMPLHVEGADFKPVGEDGKIAVGETPGPGHSLKDWLTAEVTDVVAFANAKTKIDFAIRIPSDAKPGAYWGVLVLRNPGQYHLAPVILLNVRDAVTKVPENLTIASVDGQVSPTGAITFIARIKNDGELYEKPTSTITIRNILGQTVAEATVRAENILPGYIRRFTTKIPNSLRPGVYRATLKATYGDGGKILTAETHFWAFPKGISWAILAALATLGAACLPFVRWWRRRWTVRS